MLTGRGIPLFIERSLELCTGFRSELFHRYGAEETDHLKEYCECKDHRRVQDHRALASANSSEGVTRQHIEQLVINGASRCIRSFYHERHHIPSAQKERLFRTDGAEIVQHALGANCFPVFV